MQDKHPFAPYIRIPGKEKRGSRGFTLEEAYESMTMILKDKVTAEQLALVWRGEEINEYGEAATMATADIALKLMGKADSPADAMEKADAMGNKSRH